MNRRYMLLFIVEIIIITIFIYYIFTHPLVTNQSNLIVLITAELVYIMYDEIKTIIRK